MHETRIVADLGKNVLPEACLANYGCQGCVKTILDAKSIDYLLNNLHKFKCQKVRAQIWTLLAEHLQLLMVSPDQFISCALENISEEQEQHTILFIASQCLEALELYIEDLGECEGYAMRLFEILLQLACNEEQLILRSRLVEKALQFLPYLTSQQIQQSFKRYLDQDKITFNDFCFISKTCLVKEHKLTGKQRKSIIRHLLKNHGDDSERSLSNLSDSEDLKCQKQCLACLPKLKDKEMVWLKVINGEVSERELEIIADDLYESHNDNC